MNFMLHLGREEVQNVFKGTAGSCFLEVGLTGFVFVTTVAALNPQTGNVTGLQSGLLLSSPDG
eukprot:8424085-Prorocentrum_lima.AAC.1